MTDVIPLIRQLEDCRTDLERAQWLLTADLEVFVLCELTIRRTLRQAGFLGGVTYLETELAALRRPRRSNGHLFNSMEIGAARGVMYRVALGMPPVW